MSLLVLLCALLAFSQAADIMDEVENDETVPEDFSNELETEEILSEDIMDGVERDETVPEDFSNELDTEGILSEVQLEEEPGNWTDAEEQTFEIPDEETYLKALNGSVQRSGSCSPRWARIKGRCYHVFPIPTTWFRSRSNCRSIGAHLASVHDIEVNYQLLRMISAAGWGRSGVWIGGTDLGRERRWYWVDGTRFRYSNWCRGEPNNLWFNQHCMLMNFGRFRCWDDEVCNYHKPFICVRNY